MLVKRNVIKFILVFLAVLIIICFGLNSFINRGNSFIYDLQATDLLIIFIFLFFVLGVTGGLLIWFDENVFENRIKQIALRTIRTNENCSNCGYKLSEDWIVFPFCKNQISEKFTTANNNLIVESEERNQNAIGIEKSEILENQILIKRIVSQSEVEVIKEIDAMDVVADEDKNTTGDPVISEISGVITAEKKNRKRRSSLKNKSN